MAEHITSKQKADMSKKVEAFQICKTPLIKETGLISLVAFKSFDKRNIVPFLSEMQTVNAITYKYF